MRIYDWLVAIKKEYMENRDPLNFFLHLLKPNTFFTLLIILLLIKLVTFVTSSL